MKVARNKNVGRFCSLVQKTKKNVDVLNERPIWQICLNGGMPAFRCFRVSDNSVKTNEKPVNIDFFVPANYTIFEFNEAN